MEIQRDLVLHILCNNGCILRIGNMIVQFLQFSARIIDSLGGSPGAICCFYLPAVLGKNEVTCCAVTKSETSNSRSPSTPFTCRLSLATEAVSIYFPLSWQRLVFLPKYLSPLRIDKMSRSYLGAFAHCIYAQHSRVGEQPIVFRVQEMTSTC